jgi:hypothetical protein
VVRLLAENGAEDHQCRHMRTIAAIVVAILILAGLAGVARLLGNGWRAKGTP